MVRAGIWIRGKWRAPVGAVGPVGAVQHLLVCTIVFGRAREISENSVGSRVWGEPR